MIILDTSIFVTGPPRIRDEPGSSSAQLVLHLNRAMNNGLSAPQASHVLTHLVCHRG